MLPHELEVVRRKKAARKCDPKDELNAALGGADAEPSENADPNTGSGNLVGDSNASGASRVCPVAGPDPQSEAKAGQRGQGRQEADEVGAGPSGPSKGTTKLHALREKYMLTQLPKFDPDNMLQWLKHDVRFLREPDKRKTKPLQFSAQ